MEINHVREATMRTNEEIEFLEDSRLEARDHLRLIVETFEKHPETILPTPLLAAIVSAKEIL